MLNLVMEVRQLVTGFRVEEARLCNNYGDPAVIEQA